MIIQNVLFTKDECTQLLNEHSNFEKSSVHRGAYITEVNKDFRSSKESTVSMSESTKSLLLQKLKEFDVIDLPGYTKVLKYDVGDEFKRHQDKGPGPEISTRYKTLIIQLSDSIDYDGGDLVIEDGNNKIIMNKQLGNTIMFDSTHWHQAFPIIEGIRYVFVIWLEKKHLLKKINGLI